MRYRIIVLGALVLATATQAQQPDPAKPKKDTTKVVQTAIGGVSLPPRTATDSPSFRRIIQVYDPETQEGIADVEVVDRITGNSMKTSSTGNVALIPEFVRASGALLTFRKMGYDAIEFIADPKSDTALLVPMSRSVPTLPGMTVTAVESKHLSPAMSEFQDRMTHIAGAKFITPDEMRKEDDSRELAYVFKAHGIFLGGRGSMSFTNKYCQAKGYLNGVPGSIDLGSKAREYEAVEFYPGSASAPVQYSSGATCGVVLLWSREKY